MRAVLRPHQPLQGLARFRNVVLDLATLSNIAFMDGLSPNPKP